MRIGRIAGTVVATIKHPALARWRWLLVDYLAPDGAPTGDYVIALDAGVGADQGQTVLIMDEGNGARDVLGDPAAPVRTVVVGIVDAVAWEKGELEEAASAKTPRPRVKRQLGKRGAREGHPR
jgi:microcompartment protein CcmK/EutM